MGRNMLHIWKEPYAVTLWTWCQIQQRNRVHSLTREHERIDVAGLVAMAFHDPKQLATAERRFMNKVASASDTPASRSAWKDKALERLKRLQHLRPVPMELTDV
jgi:hypothetical protein